MKPIIRNLVSVIRRFKLAAALNILGLSVAFAAFMVIMIQLDYDYGFDKFHKDYDKIYRVERVGNTWGAVVVSRPFAERFFESSPHIVAGALANSWESEVFFYVEKDDERNFYRENSLVVTPEFFNVFTFDFVEGSAGVNLAPGSIFIPMSMKRKLFGNDEPAVGKHIVHTGWGNQTVTGVYRDLPANSIVSNCIYFAMQPNENKESWMNNNYCAYIRVNQSSNASMLFENFKRTFGESLLSSADQYMGWGRKYKGEDVSFQIIPVHYNFLRVLGIEITEGRDFREEDANNPSGVFVFNETAQKRYNLETGETIGAQGEIIGFMPDIKFASFRMAVEPMAFYVWGTQNWSDRMAQSYIRVQAGTNMRAAMTHVHATLAQFNPMSQFNLEHTFFYEVRFFDEVLQRLYEKETALSSLITLFSLIAIFISIVGVFGLVVFDSECRRKEIGIRKVLGASTMGIIIMFNKAYFKILLICFVMAAPLAWYAVTRWLENFAYKTPMYWWVYLLALVAVGVITVCTVTFQNWRVANDDPVKSIKTE